MADITVTGNESYFNEKATFFKGIVVYDDIKFGDNQILLSFYIGSPLTPPTSNQYNPTAPLPSA